MSHDKELRLFNDITFRLNSAMDEIYAIVAYSEGSVVTKEMRDSIVLAGVYIKDAEDKFKRYAGLKYDEDR